MDKSKIKGLAIAIPIVVIAIFAVGEEKKFEEERASEKNVIGEESKQKTQMESSEILQESSTQIVTTDTKCDSSYPEVCIAPFPPDLDCHEIEYSNFRVFQPDPHSFDQDNDGIGCEK